MFNGRIDRIGYLLGSLYLLLPVIGVILLYAIINLLIPSGEGGAFRVLMNVILFLAGFASVILIIPASIGLCVRRWHDIGQTGWMTLLVYIPYLGVVFNLILLFLPGQKGKNTYGVQKSPRGFVPAVFGK